MLSFSDGGYIAFGSFHVAVIVRLDSSMSLQHLIAHFFLDLNSTSLSAGTSLSMKLLKDHSYFQDVL